MQPINYLSIYDHDRRSYAIRKKRSGTIKVFIVDDNETYLALLEAELGQVEDVALYTFTSGYACLNNLFHRPDLVVLDYHLGEGEENGAEILKRIKATHPQTEVIIVSGDQKVKLFEDLKTNGASALLEKQQNGNEKRTLRSKIKAIVNRKAETFTERILIFIGLLLMATLTGIFLFQNLL